MPEREYMATKMTKQSRKIPYGYILTVKDIGNLIKAHRKLQSATQAEFAAMCGVGVRFISELENGKQTIELGKALHVLRSIGLEVMIQPRSWASSTVDNSPAENL